MNYAKAEEQIALEHQVNKNCLDKIVKLDCDLTLLYKKKYKIEYNPIYRLGKLTFESATDDAANYLTRLLSLVTNSVGEKITHKRWYGENKGEKGCLRIFFLSGLSLVLEVQKSTEGVSDGTI